ncbi:hypothetical protein DXG01_001559 [Tephrocybe rancida]|nr:hypothetical protein DXG01_001559 [Tephrocybe rancida]
MLPIPPSTAKTAQFLYLPGAIDFGASMRFNPRAGVADNHSLEVSLDIGDCALELDTLQLLLRSLKPREAAPLPGLNLGAPPNHRYYGGLLLASVMDHVSKDCVLPNSGFLSSGFMPSSPSSSFLQNFSASIRPRRHHLYKLCTLLKDYKKTGLDPYELKFRDISVGSSISSNQSEDAFQKRWLGKHKRVENCDPDSYAFKFSIAQVAVERRTRLDSMRLLTLDAMNLQALTTQWPAPWLTPSTFLVGDPGAPFLAVHSKIGGIDIIEHLERLRELVAHVEPSIKPDPPQSTSSTYLKMHRIVVEAECGTLRARIICADTKSGEPFAVEVLGDGHAIASVNHNVDTIVSVSASSPILELHISTDAICMEVWNPHVVVAVQQLSSVVLKREDKPPPPVADRRPLLDRMPPGISTTVTIPRLVVFLTSPDINPNDTLELSRGIAFRTSLSMNYSSMHSSRAHRFHDLNDQTIK